VVGRNLQSSLVSHVPPNHSDRESKLLNREEKRMLPLWKELPLDVVGRIVAYTGKLKRNGNRFVNQIDVYSQRYDAVRGTIQQKIKAKEKITRDGERYYIDIALTETMGVIYDHLWYGDGFQISFYRDQRKNLCYRMSHPFYRMFRVYHPYYFIHTHTSV
jgi:hypothetical protein